MVEIRHFCARTKQKQVLRFTQDDKFVTDGGGTRPHVDCADYDGAAIPRLRSGLTPHAPWHFLYFLPEPQGQGSLRPTFSAPRTTCWTVRCSPPPAIRACSSSRRFLRWKD